MGTEEISGKAPGGGKPWRILCVDSDRGFAVHAKFMLEGMGHQVTLFARPDEALDALACCPGGWDMVITDYSLDGASGLDFARAVRVMYSGLPCAVISAYQGRETARAAAAAGLAPVLPKPRVLEDFDALLAWIARQVEADSARAGRPATDYLART